MKTRVRSLRADAHQHDILSGKCAGDGGALPRCQQGDAKQGGGPRTKGVLRGKGGEGRGGEKREGEGRGGEGIGGVPRGGRRQGDR